MSKLPMCHSISLCQASPPTYTSALQEGEPQAPLPSLTFACADSLAQCILSFWEKMCHCYADMLEYLLRHLFFLVTCFPVAFWLCCRGNWWHRDAHVGCAPHYLPPAMGGSKWAGREGDTASPNAGHPSVHSALLPSLLHFKACFSFMNKKPAVHDL